MNFFSSKISFFKIFFLDLFWPSFCLGCQKEGEIICVDCLSLIEIFEYQFCPFCKTPHRTLDKGTCLIHRSQNLNGLFTAVSYQNPLIKQLIKNFKYPPFLKKLGQSLTNFIIIHFLLSGKKKFFQPLEDSFFIPIPLFYSRQQWRGFNQAEEIAKILSFYFKVPYQINNLIKIKKIQPQTELREEKRRKNVKNVFKICQPQKIEGKRIFLVDDVFTTGSTLEEAAKILKQSGAKEVWGITIAKE